MKTTTQEKARLIIRFLNDPNDVINHTRAQKLVSRMARHLECDIPDIINNLFLVSEGHDI